MPSQLTDKELIGRTLSGEEKAFESLAERHSRLVFQIAYARFGNRETAEDLCQEVFLRVYLHLDSFNVSHRFTSWLGQIARNLANDWLRSGKKMSQLVPMITMDDKVMEIEDEGTVTPRETMALNQESDAVRKAIFQLPVEQREMILLHYSEGLTKRDVARELGVHPSTVGRQIKKALEKLEGNLEPILVESTAPLRTSSATVSGTVALIAAAATLSAPAKAALAATAGAIKAAPAAEATGFGLLRVARELLRIAKPAIKIIGTGGTIVSTGKVITAISVAGVLGVGGIVYHQQLSKDRVSVSLRKPASAGDRTAIEGVLEEIRAALERGDYATLREKGLRGGPEESMEERIHRELGNDVIEAYDYVFKAELAELHGEGDRLRAILKEPWKGTTANLHFVRSAGTWRIRDINAMSGYGRPTGDLAGTRIPAKRDTTSMSDEDIVRAFYNAWISGDFDEAAGYLDTQNDEETIQYRNLLQSFRCVEEILELKKVGENVFVRFKVGSDFPGGGLAVSVGLANERRGTVYLKERESGPKIIHKLSGILGDKPRDYENN